MTSAELLATSPSALIAPTGGNDREAEARMWDAFAEVYEKELATLKASSGSSSEVSKERKRQVLADILVWAEITQSHYDQNTAS
jgi:VIT1/CCC1 family predicted Fe2+/Mn2+ transporter